MTRANGRMSVRRAVLMGERPAVRGGTCLEVNAKLMRRMKTRRWDCCYVDLCSPGYFDFDYEFDSRTDPSLSSQTANTSPASVSAFAAYHPDPCADLEQKRRTCCGSGSWHRRGCRMHTRTAASRASRSRSLSKSRRWRIPVKSVKGEVRLS